MLNFIGLNAKVCFLRNSKKAGLLGLILIVQIFANEEWTASFGLGHRQLVWDKKVCCLPATKLMFTYCMAMSSNARLHITLLQKTHSIGSFGASRRYHAHTTNGRIIH